VRLLLGSTPRARLPGQVITRLSDIRSSAHGAFLPLFFVLLFFCSFKNKRRSFVSLFLVATRGLQTGKKRKQNMQSSVLLDRLYLYNKQKRHAVMPALFVFLKLHFHKRQSTNTTIINILFRPEKHAILAQQHILVYHV
jgi:hypothetical protein